MDTQNLLEKLAIVKDIGDIKVTLARIEAKQMQAEEHHKVLFGSDGQSGLVTTVDRLNEAEKSRVTHNGVVFAALVSLFMERGYSWITRLQGH